MHRLDTRATLLQTAIEGGKERTSMDPTKSHLVILALSRGWRDADGPTRSRVVDDLDTHPYTETSVSANRVSPRNLVALLHGRWSLRRGRGSRRNPECTERVGRTHAVEVRARRAA
jgi:hypothetical protein